MGTMKAAVMYAPGGPGVFKIEERPIPTPQAGQVLIRVRAFGLNRSELFTRRGFSPSVKFPRILGIEAVGEVEEAPGGEFRKGDKVASVMGGMGRVFLARSPGDRSPPDPRPFSLLLSFAFLTSRTT